MKFNPKLPEDFSEIKKQYRHAVCLYIETGDRVRAMKGAGYRANKRENLSQTFKYMMEKEDVREYEKYMRENPNMRREALRWFEDGKDLAKEKTIILSPLHAPIDLQDEKVKEFLECYFALGDKVQAMKACNFFPPNSKNDSYLKHKASYILQQKPAIEYMTLLNNQALQELFLSKSKIIKDVYELAKDAKDNKSRFAAVKAYELLGRMTGLLDSGSKSVKVQDGGKIEINYITPDRIDTRLHKDINDFIDKDHPKEPKIKDLDWVKYDKDGGRNIDEEDERRLKEDEDEDKEYQDFIDLKDDNDDE